MKFGSLFSGVGGLDLGLERAGMECVFQVEIDGYCTRVLEKQWPDVPKHRDIRDIEELPYVDLICGGFPCQAFSSAARGRNNAPDLWPEMLRIVSINGPEYIIAENVTKRAIERAEADVQELGYKTGVRRIGAYEVGADHQRNRWWLFAHAHDKSKLSSVLNAKVALLPEIREGIWGWQSFANRRRVAHGIPSRVDRLRGLGNAVVPQVAEWIGRRIMAYDTVYIDKEK